MKFRSILNKAAASFTLAFACLLPAQAQSVSGQGNWETTLLGRDLNRNAVAATDVSAVYLYDTTLGVTWLRNALTLGSGDWNTVNARVADLTTGFGSNTISDWRLPTMTDTGAPGCDYSTNGSDCGFNPVASGNEMASLFYITLGNKALVDISGTAQTGYGLTNIGSFQNLQYLQSSPSWLGTEYALSSSAAWWFYLGNGNQNVLNKGYNYPALAVRTGDVLAPVPEPETYAMLLAGLVVVSALSRRRSRSVMSLVA